MVKNKLKDLVSIIIVNWNGKDLLRICLTSLKKQNYKNIEIILVDNASIDGSVEWVTKYFSQIKIIINKKNLGFAEANNIGFKEARGEYVLFLNNDTRVTNNFIVEMLKVLKRKNIGGVQSKILFMDDPKRLDGVGSYLTYTGFLYHQGIYAINTSKYDKEIEIFSAKGACMCFKKSVLDKILVDGDIFDRRYFAYFEETDLCFRIWLLGYKIIYVPSSIIYHKYGATSQKLKKPFIEYNSYKNRICTYIKNLETLSLIKILFPHLVICKILALIFIFKGRLDISLSIEKAIWWNLINLRRTLIYRNIIQGKIRQVKDGIIFPIVLRNVGFSYYFNHLKGWNTTQIDV